MQINRQHNRSYETLISMKMSNCILKTTETFPCPITKLCCSSQSKELEKGIHNLVSAHFSATSVQLIHAFSKKDIASNVILKSLSIKDLICLGWFWWFSVHVLNFGLCQQSHNEDIVKSYCISKWIQNNHSSYFKKWAPVRLFSLSFYYHTAIFMQRMIY